MASLSMELCHLLNSARTMDFPAAPDRIQWTIFQQHPPDKSPIESMFNRHYDTIMRVWVSSFQSHHELRVWSTQNHLEDDPMVHMRIEQLRRREQPSFIICNYCHKSYRQKCNLVRHKMAMHSKKTYSCTWCYYKFKYKTNCTRHEKNCKAKQRSLFQDIRNGTCYVKKIK